MAQYELLNQRRNAQKSAVTRIEHWIKRLSTEEDDVYEFVTREESITKAFDEYNAVQDQMEIIDAEECKDREAFEIVYFKVLSRLRRKIREFSPQLPNAPQQRIVVQSPLSNIPQVKLPEIYVPCFSGDLTLWNSFYEIYCTLIYNNDELTKIQKLIYLKSYLRNEPLKLIENLQLTNDNLEIALNTLKQRYSNNVQTVFAHIGKILEIPSLNKITHTTLREFITQIKQNLEALRNLKLPVDQWDLMLIFVLMQKLDAGTRKAYELDKCSKSTNSNTLPTMKDYLQFLENRCLALENLSLAEFSNTSNASQRKITHYMHSENRAGDVTHKTCIFCNLKNHSMYNCVHFKNVSHEERLKFVRNAKLCINCFSNSHMVKDCKSHNCHICQKRHNTLLHNTSAQILHDNRRTTNSTNEQYPTTNLTSSVNRRQIPCFSGSNNIQLRTSNPQSSTSTSHNRNQNHNNTSSNQNVNNFPPQTLQDHTILASFTPSGEILLATATVIVYTADNKPLKVKALLDSCSTTSLITESLAKQLHFPLETQNVCISGVNGTTTNCNKVLSLKIYSHINNNFSLQLTCSVLKKITRSLPNIPLLKNKLEIPQNIKLADPTFHVPSQIDILLGADAYYSVICGDVINLNRKFLTLINTELGYIIGGSIPSEVVNKYTNKSNCDYLENLCFFAQTSLEDKIEKFWTIENIPSHERILSSEEQYVENEFLSTTIMLPSGHFQVNLPLKSSTEHLKLGCSYYTAEKQFLSLEKRFKRDPNLFLQYKQFIEEYVSLGHAQIIPLNLKNAYGEFKYFFPHHPVIRNDHVTTKLRTVFNGSQKTSSGFSLNDIMYKGFTVQPELIDILCRFRSFKYGLTCDIQKMYRQIRINPCHTFLQNILWRDHPLESLKCIELLTVSYGTNSAPYLATRVLNLLATSISDFKLASQSLLEQTYVDDILAGTNSFSGLNKLYAELNSLLGSANFPLHKWNSNSLRFLSSIGHCLQQSQDIFPEGTCNKVLGLCWNPEFDCFSISIPKITTINSYTKREVLSKIAQMYDPLGFIGPVVVIAKIIMQKLWMEKMDWDSVLSADLLNEWLHFYYQITQLERLKIPRYFLNDPHFLSIDIQGFSDSSMQAYGACIYFRAVYPNDTVSSHLIISKSRIAPLKTVSLARLELCSCLLLAQLLQKILAIFKDKFSFSSINLWSDSQIALAWIASHPSRWSVFVANRVSDIQQLTQNAIWRYIPSSDNPADCLSRGMLPQDLLNFKLWWQGPSLLMSVNPSLFSNLIPPEITDLPEKRTVKPVLHVIQENFWSQLFSKFSSFYKLQRVIAFCSRFANNCLSSEKRKGPLTSQELKKSLTLIVKIIQENHFSIVIDEINSNKPISNKHIWKLYPFIDETGLLRVGGRLSFSTLPYDQRHPILLPSKNNLVSLMLKNEHIRLGHAGSQNVLSNFRLRFWPLGGLREVKRIIKNCLTCHRFKAQSYSQIMSDLPSVRIKPSRPFSNTGLDFGGPFFIKASNIRKAKITKCYVSVFICMVTKAVHIELVSDLSTEAFLLCLKRFIARRGAPHKLYSDNATNFLGARNQLRELYLFFREKSTSESIQNFLAPKEIEWKFIPPQSPHWGGLWEAAIKSTKYHLRRLLGESCFTFEEFSTILSQVEAILNSRPISPLSADPSDMQVLTPGHFLIGDSLMSFPEKDFSETPENRLTRWQRCTKVQQLFWKRWSVEYLNQLQNRPKWYIPQENIKLDDIVLLKDENTKPLQWPLARVIEIFDSKDNRIRLVKVKTKNGIYIRNITKLCPLPNAS